MLPLMPSRRALCSTLFPYTTLFRSGQRHRGHLRGPGRVRRDDSSDDAPRPRLSRVGRRPLRRGQHARPRAAHLDVCADERHVPVRDRARRPRRRLRRARESRTRPGRQHLARPGRASRGRRGARREADTARRVPALTFRVGTSGYNYAEWKGTFYPADLPASKMLGYYVERFSTVEINATFYRMPNARTLAGWRDAAPAGFTFVLTAPH